MFLEYTLGEGSHLGLVIETDEKVAYAYLLSRGQIVGDVWLYNVVTGNVEAEGADGATHPSGLSRTGTRSQEPLPSDSLSAKWSCA